MELLEQQKALKKQIKTAVRQVRCKSSAQAYRAAHAVNEARIIATWIIGFVEIKSGDMDKALRELEDAFYKEAKRLAKK